MGSQQKKFLYRNQQPIIIIGGVCGVGKSVITDLLKNILPIRYAMSAVMINWLFRGPKRTRQVFVAKLPSFHQILERYHSPQKIIAVLEQNTLVIAPYLYNCIHHSFQRNEGIIIQGTLALTRVNDKIWSGPKTEIMLDCSDLRALKGRIKSRIQNTASKYIKARDRIKLAEFKKMLLVKDYFLQVAKDKGIPVVDNQNIEQAVIDCLEIVYQDWPHLKTFNYRPHLKSLLASAKYIIPDYPK